MADVEVRIEGGDALIAALIAKAEAGHDAAQAASRKMALSFIASAKKNATGPARVRGRERRTRGKRGQPAQTLAWGAGGPGVVTGYLRGSIQVRHERSYGSGGWEADVYPAGPYYRRLELGFTGRDSLGRRYNQPPYPFMRPALDTTRAKACAISITEFRRVQAA